MALLFLGLLFTLQCNPSIDVEIQESLEQFSGNLFRQLLLFIKKIYYYYVYVSL